MVRVERLGAAAQELLRLIAAGQRVDHALLKAAAGLEPAVLREALRETVAAHVVVVDGEGAYGFRHALLREVVGDDLLPGERVALHAALAAAFEARLATDPSPAALAAAAAHHHAAGDRPAALSASVRAAGAAEQVHAYGEALALFERALELWPAVPDARERAGTDHAGLLTRAAAAADTQGESARTEALASAALAALDGAAEPHRRAALHVRLARAQRRLGRADAALATVARGRELLPEGEASPQRAQLLALAAKIRMLQGRYAEGSGAADEALAAARAAGDRESEGASLNTLGVCLAATGETEAGIASLREALAIAGPDGRPGEVHDAYTNLADVLFLAGRDREAMAVALEGLAAPRRTRRGTDWLSTAIAEMAYEAGDWAGAERRLPDRRGEGNQHANTALRRTQIALGRGDLARARTTLAEVADAVEDTGEPQFHGPFGVMLAELERRSGDLPAARAAIDAALDRIEFCAEDALRVAMVAAAGVGVEADAAQRARDVGDRETLAVALGRLEALLARVQAVAHDIGRPVEAALLAGARADAARAEGEPRRTASAAADAAGAWEALARPYSAAQLRWHEAEAHVLAGDRDAAAAAAARARATAEALGADWLRDEVDGLVARARLATDAPGDADADGGAGEPAAEALPFGLTARELQVLRLVAGGATNREVGATLFMAEKTASVHVSWILAKLDVRSRTEAAAVAHRNGLELQAPRPAA